MIINERPCNMPFFSCLKIAYGYNKFAEVNAYESKGSNNVYVIFTLNVIPCVLGGGGGVAQKYFKSKYSFHSSYSE